MNSDEHGSQVAHALCVSPRDFFNEVIDDAFEHRKLKTSPYVKPYLVHMLEFYMSSANLFDELDSEGRRTRATLAETFLRAANAEPTLRVGLLKKLADTSLYVSGFFASSLQRKIVDVDYYANMGGAAYATLASSVQEDSAVQVYREFSVRFLEFADILGYISSKSSLQNEENILRLYEHYARTGSPTAREQLLAKGLIAVPLDQLKKTKKQ